MISKYRSSTFPILLLAIALAGCVQSAAAGDGAITLPPHTALPPTAADLTTPTVTVVQSSTPTPRPTQHPAVASTPTAAPTRVSAVESNDAWNPVIEVFDGVEMVLVPPGCFAVGGQAHVASEVCLNAPYWLDRTEVTIGPFNAAPSVPDADFPQSEVTYPAAAAYCAARGGRLPTEIEWEYAARGPDALIYPWGNRFDATVVNSSVGGFEGPVRVGSYPGGASWVGALDMAGNLWEWTTTVYDPDRYPYPPIDPGDDRDSNPAPNSPRVIRGGSWSNEFFFMRTFSRKGKHPTEEWYGYVGFRCLRAIDGQ